MKIEKNRISALFGKISLVLALAAGTSVQLQAQAQQQDQNNGKTYELSLKQAVDFGVQNSSKAQNADLDVKMAQQKVNEVRAVGLPQVNGSFEFDDYLKLPTQLLPGEFFGQPGTYIPIKFGTKYNATAGLTASQLIFNGTYLVGLKAASTYVDLSKKLAKSSKIDVANNVTKAYYGVLVAQKRLGLIDASLLRLEKAYNDTKAMYQNGFVEKLDVDRLEVSLNNLKIEKQKVQNLIQLSTNLLKFQMGMPVSAAVTLTDSLAENNLPAPQDMKPDPSKRIEYSILQVNRLLNEYDMKRYKSGYLPSLAAFGSYSEQAQRNEFNFFDTKQKWYPIGIVGAKLTVPIFDGLQKSAQIQQAKMNIQKTDNDLANIQRVVEMDVSNAVLQYENNYETLKNQRRNLELAQEVVRVTQIKYEQGVGTNLEVVNAEAGLKEAQTNYFSALYDLLISQVDVERASGTLY